jgi:hypothetical protein
MESLTRQQIFDKVLTHLRKQQYQSIGTFTDPHGNKQKSCMYWDKETGRKCAVGCLIDENLYDPRIEGVAINYRAYVGVETPRQYSLQKTLVESGIDTADNDICYLLIRLQEIHDNANKEGLAGELSTYFEHEMKCLAVYTELEYHEP